MTIEPTNPEELEKELKRIREELHNLFKCYVETKIKKIETLLPTCLGKVKFKHSRKGVIVEIE